MCENLFPTIGLVNQQVYHYRMNKELNISLNGSLPDGSKSRSIQDRNPSIQFVNGTEIIEARAQRFNNEIDTVIEVEHTDFTFFGYDITDLKIQLTPRKSKEGLLDHTSVTVNAREEGSLDSLDFVFRIAKNKIKHVFIDSPKDDESLSYIVDDNDEVVLSLPENIVTTQMKANASIAVAAISKYITLLNRYI